MAVTATALRKLSERKPSFRRVVCESRVPAACQALADEQNVLGRIVFKSRSAHRRHRHHNYLTATFKAVEVLLGSAKTLELQTLAALLEWVNALDVVQQHVRSLRDLADGELLLQIMRDINPQDRRPGSLVQLRIWATLDNDLPKRTKHYIALKEEQERWEEDRQKLMSDLESERSKRLEAQETKLDQEISSYQSELRQKDAEMERLREELEVARVESQKAQKLQSQLEIFKKRLEEQEKEELRRQLDEITSSNKAGSGTVEHLHGRLAALRDELQTANRERDQAQLQVKLLQGELEQATLAASTGPAPATAPAAAPLPATLPVAPVASQLAAEEREELRAANRELQSQAAAERFRAAPFEAPDGTAHGGGAAGRGVRVCVRKRPIFEHEIEQGPPCIKTGGARAIAPAREWGAGREFDAITCMEGRVVVHDARMHPDMVKLFMNHYDFAFDETFGEVANNVEVYQGTARQLVLDSLQGKSGTVMMYGQTGSSVYEQAAEDIFLGAQGRSVTVSFIELFGENCFDMLMLGTA
eukprot:g33569.t1